MKTQLPRCHIRFSLSTLFSNSLLHFPPFQAGFRRPILLENDSLCAGQGVLGATACLDSPKVYHTVQWTASAGKHGLFLNLVFVLIMTFFSLAHQDDSLLPALMTRLEQAEKTIQELSDRLVSLESELNQLQTDEVNTPESSSTFCSAHPNAFVTGHTDDQASSDSNSASGVEEHAKTNGGPKVDHPQTNGSVAHPQPPPEPPSVDNFKFTSTPNPVFLSRGKLHHKVKGNKSADASPTKNPSSESVVDGEDFQKSKKQRFVLFL